MGHVVLAQICGFIPASRGALGVQPRGCGFLVGFLYNVCHPVDITLQLSASSTVTFGAPSDVTLVQEMRIHKPQVLGLLVLTRFHAP